MRSVFDIVRWPPSCVSLWSVGALLVTTRHVPCRDSLSLLTSVPSPLNWLVWLIFAISQCYPQTNEIVTNRFALLACVSNEHNIARRGCSVCSRAGTSHLSHCVCLRGLEHSLARAIINENNQNMTHSQDRWLDLQLSVKHVTHTFTTLPTHLSILINNCAIIMIATRIHVLGLGTLETRGERFGTVITFDLSNVLFSIVILVLLRRSPFSINHFSYVYI